MASLYHTTGIILSRSDFREADRRYSAFTREHGKVEFLARGGHKPLAKLTPHLEMPAEVEMLVVDGRTFQTVAGVERRRAFPNLYRDPSRLLLASGGLHLVDIGTRTQEPDPALYDTLVDWLAFLDAWSSFIRPDGTQPVTQERSAFLLASFGLKLMALIGYRPELYRCLACKCAIEPERYRWHAIRGGVVCASCAGRDAGQWFAARPLSDEALKLVRFALAEPFEAQLRPALPAGALTAFHETVESLIISHFPTIPANSLRDACLV